ncbi:MAG: hypothetical protein KJZ52_09320, partial [Anaerolineales bacterium]|nr:hypothetical protein [Anaerolineales bacterium]
RRGVSWCHLLLRFCNRLGVRCNGRPRPSYNLICRLKIGIPSNSCEGKGEVDFSGWLIVLH